MEFQNTQFNGLGIGVSRNVEKSPVLAKSITESLVNSFGVATQTDWWLWWRLDICNGLTYPGATRLGRGAGALDRHCQRQAGV